jgi:amino acid transporter
VIQTGAIAGVAFVLGDYAATLHPIGPYGGAFYAALSIVALTAINMAGTFQSKTLQTVVTLVEVGAILVIIAFGLLGDPAPAAPGGVSPPGQAALGLGLVFVLLT